MFDNIGGKIIALAKLVCWLDIIVFLVIGIIVISNRDSVFLGIMIIVVGALLSWVGSFLLYGFGQLIENSDAITLLLDQLLEVALKKE